MFDVGAQEIILILVIALVVFGPKKLPEIGRTLGRTLQEFKRASNELMAAVQEPLKDIKDIKVTDDDDKQIEKEGDVSHVSDRND